jgi:UDP-N-acetylmuramoyl-L-alanyl-D-glutamate--2,6-diaminopimelate ligase
LVEDSRVVQPGDVFLARVGEGVDGRAFIGQAEALGAVAILSDAIGCKAATIPALLSERPERVGAVLAQRLAGSPSERLSLVGVTGTNGKTTVSTLLADVFRGVGPCGLLGGICIEDGLDREAASLTTPMAADVAQWLRRTVAHGCDRAVMEVSSHAIDQGRVEGLRFAGGIFTNLSGDHLDYHGSMDAYARCKHQLFASLPSDGFAIVNLDDPASEDMVAGISADVVRCTLGGGGDVNGRIVESSVDGTTVSVESPWGCGVVSVPLAGSHNAMNAMQALAAACVMGLGFRQASDRIATAKAPPGRLERVCERPRVFVDFAHTDAALEAVLQSLQDLVPPGGRILVVVGCGGDRDRTKRPRMAAIACAADRVWLTSDNPRSEDPHRILADMMEGVPEAAAATVDAIVDRRQAIGDAIREASPEDIVLIAGKGHEQVQLIGSQAFPFDDRRVALDAVQQRGARA